MRDICTYLAGDISVEHGVFDMGARRKVVLSIQLWTYVTPVGRALAVASLKAVMHVVDACHDTYVRSARMVTRRTYRLRHFARGRSLL